MTDEISAREARDNWSDLLDRVQWRGETITITRNGKPAARLTPLPSPQSSAQDDVS